MSKNGRNKQNPPAPTTTPSAPAPSANQVVAPIANTGPSDLDRYIKLQQAAERQIERAWTAYKILGGLLGVVVVVFGLLGFKSLRDFKTDLQDTFKATTDTELARMRGEVSELSKKELDGIRKTLGKRTDEEVMHLKATVTSRVDDEFKTEQIRRTIEAVASQESSKVIKGLVQPEATRVREELKALLTQVQEKANAEVKELGTIRDQVETQAATIKSIAGDSTHAKQAIESLEAAIQRAQTTLDEVKNVTGGITVLPDGRLAFGGLITGRAWILFTNLARMFDATGEGKFPEVYEVATDSIKRHEESLELEKQAGNRFGDVIINPEGISGLYALGAQAALNVGKFDDALKWARKAVQNEATSEANVILGRALRASQLEEEAASHLRELETTDSQAAERLKKMFQK